MSSTSTTSNNRKEKNIDDNSFILGGQIVSPPTSTRRSSERRRYSGYGYGRLGKGARRRIGIESCLNFDLEAGRDGEGSVVSSISNSLSGSEFGDAASAATAGVATASTDLNASTEVALSRAHSLPLSETTNTSTMTPPSKQKIELRDWDIEREEDEDNFHRDANENNLLGMKSIISKRPMPIFPDEDSPEKTKIVKKKALHSIDQGEGDGNDCKDFVREKVEVPLPVAKGGQPEMEKTTTKRTMKATKTTPRTTTPVQNIISATAAVTNSGAGTSGGIFDMLGADTLEDLGSSSSSEEESVNEIEPANVDEESPAKENVSRKRRRMGRHKNVAVCSLGSI